MPAPIVLVGAPIALGGHRASADSERTMDVVAALVEAALRTGSDEVVRSTRPLAVSRTFEPVR